MLRDGNVSHERGCGSLLKEDSWVTWKRLPEPLGVCSANRNPHRQHTNQTFIIENKQNSIEYTIESTLIFYENTLIYVLILDIAKIAFWTLQNWLLGHVQKTCRKSLIPAALGLWELLVLAP